MSGILRAISSTDTESSDLGLEAIAEVPLIAYAHLLPYISQVGYITMGLLDT